MTNQMTPKTARRIVRTLNADAEDNWTYKTIQANGDCAQIAAYDETGAFVGYL